MSDETFLRFFRRLKTYAQRVEGQTLYLPHERTCVRAGVGETSPVRVLMCGMGECLTHPQCPEWIQRIRSEVGVRVSIVTNGALLDEAMMKRLIAASVTVVIVSVPGLDRESYSRYMKLDWDTVMTNVLRAHAMLPRRVEVSVTIPRNAPFTAQDVVAFWGARGIPISSIIACHNRGGFMTNRQLLSSPGSAKGNFCGIIARHNFTAWDGRMLSCCHDLRGENVLGDVHRDEFADLALRKTLLLDGGPRYEICRVCDDPQRVVRDGIAMLGWS